MSRRPIRNWIHGAIALVAFGCGPESVEMSDSMRLTATVHALELQILQYPAFTKYPVHVDWAPHGKPEGFDAELVRLGLHPYIPDHAGEQMGHRLQITSTWALEDDGMEMTVTCFNPWTTIEDNYTHRWSRNGWSYPPILHLTPISCDFGYDG